MRQVDDSLQPAEIDTLCTLQGVGPDRLQIAAISTRGGQPEERPEEMTTIQMTLLSTEDLGEPTAQHLLTSITRLLGADDQADQPGRADSSDNDAEVGAAVPFGAEPEPELSHESVSERQLRRRRARAKRGRRRRYRKGEVSSSDSLSSKSEDSSEDSEPEQDWMVPGSVAEPALDSDSNSDSLSDLELDTVRDPTTWTTLQHDGPDHLGLW